VILKGELALPATSSAVTTWTKTKTILWHVPCFAQWITKRMLSWLN